MVTTVVSTDKWSADRFGANSLVTRPQRSDAGDQCEAGRAEVNGRLRPADRQLNHRQGQKRLRAPRSSLDGNQQAFGVC
jgi:hypothetical protein